MYMFFKKIFDRIKNYFPFLKKQEEIVRQIKQEEKEYIPKIKQLKK